MCVCVCVYAHMHGHIQVLATFDVELPEDLTPLWENLAIFAACVLATRAGSGVFGTDDEGDAGRTFGGSDE